MAEQSRSITKMLSTERTFNLKKEISKYVSQLSEENKIVFINEMKLLLHSLSPFKDEPVDCVLWVKNEKLIANDYNPNKVAPPEMELLKVSILADGYTQPIVTFSQEDNFTVVDGFHRTRVGKEIEEVRQRVKGYLPITQIRECQEDRGDRIAATIRHNRARGKHQIQGMSNIVLELKRRNWSDNKIAKNLGMDADEILRLTQIGGLKDMFKDSDFSLAWEATDTTSELDIDEKELQND
jgi:ParB-like chromosome segregation protein Spo0J